MRRLKGYFSPDRGRKPVTQDHHISILRVLKQPVDVRSATEAAWKAGFTLKNFQSDDNLELHYDVYRQGKRICYLSKGWLDPGFRIGDDIEMPRSLPDFKGKFQQVYDVATKNIVSLCVTESDREKVMLNFQIGLYQGGFNPAALREAVDVMDESLDEIRRLLSDD